ncbi:uncharacterized protein ccdc175 [Pholidichthys leucotaenia]
MASCLVPDFPAVTVALEHLRELDRELKDEAAVPFYPEARVHLKEITAAVAELEAERRGAHEHLEVATIENGKLRHQIRDIRERMSEEMMADVAAARASNAEEIEQLRKDLGAASQLQEETMMKVEGLLSQNKALRAEREQVKAEHEAVVALLNDQITLKNSLQAQLDQIQEQIEELKSSIAAVEQEKSTLLQNMKLEREAFSIKEDHLSREVDHIEEEIKHQKQAIRRTRRELDRVNGKKQEAQGHLDELKIKVASLESSAQRLTASRCRCEKQLEVESQKHQDLRQQRDTLKKELHELGESFRETVHHLEEEMAAVEGKIEGFRLSRLAFQDALAEVHGVFRHRHSEEKEVRVEHSHISRQLERSKLQLEECVSSIVKHNRKIKEMEKQIRELLETDTINKCMFERDQEELCGSVNAEKKNVSQFQEQKRQLRQLLEEEKRKQEEHVSKMKSDISNTRREYEELWREEAAIHQRHPKSIDVDLLMSHVTECEKQYCQIESTHRQEILECIAEAKHITRSTMEKESEVEEKEKLLKQVEADWNEEKSRQQRLEELTFELSERSNELQQLIQTLKEKTAELLGPKQELKAKLEELQESYSHLLGKQALELRAVEVSIYNSSVKLEQVSVENSRLHLHIRQMTEDVVRARQLRSRYQQETRQLNRGTQELKKHLQEAWKEDLVLTQDCQNTDGVLLLSMSPLLDHLKSRRQKLGNVSVLLHQTMLDFSQRLGDKTTVALHS